MFESTCLREWWRREEEERDHDGKLFEFIKYSNNFGLFNITVSSAKLFEFLINSNNFPSLSVGRPQATPTKWKQHERAYSTSPITTYWNSTPSLMDFWSPIHEKGLHGGTIQMHIRRYDTYTMEKMTRSSRTCSSIWLDAWDCWCMRLLVAPAHIAMSRREQHLAKPYASRMKMTLTSCILNSLR